MDLIAEPDRVQYAMILVHGGERHYPSKLALNYWRENTVYGMEEVEVVDGRIKQWLMSNYGNVSIKEIPCILLCRSGAPTTVFSIRHLTRLVQSVQNGYKA